MEKAEEIKQYRSKVFKCLLIDYINEEVKIKSDIFSLLMDFGRESNEFATKKSR